MERVEARTRDDLHPSDFMRRPQPPKDIALDSGRLKMWQEEQRKQLEAANSREQIVEVRGCGLSKLLACHRMKSGSAFCMPRDYPHNMEPWH